MMSHTGFCALIIVRPPAALLRLTASCVTSGLCPSSFIVSDAVCRVSSVTADTHTRAAGFVL